MFLEQGLLCINSKVQLNTYRGVNASHSRKVIIHGWVFNNFIYIIS